MIRKHACCPQSKLTGLSAGEYAHFRAENMSEVIIPACRITVPVDLAHSPINSARNTGHDPPSGNPLGPGFNPSSSFLLRKEVRKEVLCAGVSEVQLQ